MNFVDVFHDLEDLSLWNVMLGLDGYPLFVAALDDAGGSYDTGRIRYFLAAIDITILAGVALDAFYFSFVQFNGKLAAHRTADAD